MPESLSRLVEVMKFVRRHGAFVRRYSLFDADWYRTSQHPHGWLAGRFPLHHYLVHGWQANALPHPGFDAESFAQKYGAFSWLKEGISPLEAYVEVGRLYGFDFGGNPAREAVRKLASPVKWSATRTPAAVVVHAFYLEELQSICKGIATSGTDMDVIVTTSLDAQVVSDAMMAMDVCPVTVSRLPNIGRDAFPFVHLINEGLLDHYSFVCKVHTKRSAHHPDAKAWFGSMLDAYLADGAARDAIANFEANPRLGMIAAHGTLTSSQNLYYSLKDLRWLSAASGRRFESDELEFAAGTMFWARTEALRPISEIGLCMDDFELEAGQLDGTLAHALERFFGLACKYAGYDIVEGTPGQAHNLTRALFR